MSGLHVSVVYVVVCGAGPASTVHRLIDDARARNWEVCVIATPAALDFIDPAAVEETYRVSGEERISSTG